MDIETAIGENYQFELREALLIYHSRGTSFVTKHDVTQSEETPPVLGPAQPLTLSFVEALVRSLGGNARAEFLPENIVAKGDRMIAWWTPERRRAMFYRNSEEKAKHLNGKVFPQPPLVWHVWNGGLRIRALRENKRPSSDTKLAVAPFWNLSSDGSVCTGSMRCPDSASVAAVASWEQGFYESNFTHSNVGRLTRHQGGFDGLWSALTNKRVPFPKDSLIQLPESLSEFIMGRRR